MPQPGAYGKLPFTNPVKTCIILLTLAPNLLVH